ncbi:MAG: biotin transporter BioY [Saprospiraceae bacterium]
MSIQLFRNIGYSLLALLALILSAQISIPLGVGTVPISAQTLAVLLIGYTLGAKRGSLVVIAYLILGALDFPVFAEGKFGLEVFKKGSGGFLYGFVLGAGLVGSLGTMVWKRSFGRSLLAMTLGTVVIVACGLAQLTYLYDWERALAYGLYPFIPGAIIKIILGAAVLPLYYRFVAKS